MCNSLSFFKEYMDIDKPMKYSVFLVVNSITGGV
jgi:hypothetical protein